MRYLLIILLFASCSPLRHYNKVVTDPFRNAAERSLLSKACIMEFPAIQDTPKVVFTGVDSSDYAAVNEAYNVLLDSLVAMYERDTVGVLIAPPGTKDSLRIIRNFLRIYKPPAVVRTVVKEVPVRNTAVENQLQDAVNNCRRESEGLIAQAQIAKDRQAKTRQTNIWLWVVGSILLIGNGVQLFSRKKLLG